MSGHYPMGCGARIRRVEVGVRCPSEECENSRDDGRHGPAMWTVEAEEEMGQLTVPDSVLDSDEMLCPYCGTRGEWD